MTGTEPARRADTRALDAAGWIDRWERQQAAYVPERAETFTLML